MSVVAQLIRGFLMGAADIVPGVSGGTVALLLGIYDRFLGVIRDGAKAIGMVVRGRPADAIDQLRRVDWLFIVPLAVGVLTAVALLSSVISDLLVDHPEAMAGLFLGLVIASLIVAWQMIERPSAALAAIAAAIGALVFVMLGFSSGPVSDPGLYIWFGAGAIAICAMILPGISGSFLLLMMGMYAAVLDAVHHRDLLELLVFLVGATVGLALFSTFLGKLLDDHRDTVLAVLVGLMIGSVRVLWPWPHGVGVISEEASEAVDGTGLDLPASIGDAWLPIVLGVAACATVLAISRLAGSSNPQPNPQGV